jgi:hypothetical protein
MNPVQRNVWDMTLSEIRHEINYILNLPKNQQNQHNQRLRDLNMELIYLLYNRENMGLPPDASNSGEGYRKKKVIKKKPNKKYY